MKFFHLLLYLAGLIEARFDNLDPSFNQVLSRLSAGEHVSPALLAKRALEWKRLYKKNPEEAFRIADATWSPDQKGRRANQQDLEEPVSGVGIISIVCGKPHSVAFDEKNESSQPLQWTSFESLGDICFKGATIDNNFYLLRFSDEHPLAKATSPLREIPLHGYAFRSGIGGAMELFPRTTAFQPLAAKSAKRRLSSSTCSPTTSPSIYLTFGSQGLDRKMCIVRYIMQDSLPVRDSSGVVISDATFQTLITKLNKFFMENSYGKLSFAPPSIFTVQGSLAAGVLDEAKMLQDWRQANPGVWCTCDAEVIVFNYNLGSFAVPYAGLGYINAQGVWINGNAAVGVWAHELGHNLGFGHARHYQLTAPSPSWQGSGQLVEYGNNYDVMGSGVVNLDAGLAEIDVSYYGAALRSFSMTSPWITASQRAQVDAEIPGGAMDVLLFPSDLGSATPVLTGNQKLAVEFSRPVEIIQSMPTDQAPTPSSIRFGRFFFEYKTKMAAPEAKKGLQVTSTTSSISSAEDRHCIQLDMNPQTTTSLDSFLSWGSTFSDCTPGVHVTAEQADCPGAAANSKGCARALIRNGFGGRNIVLTVTDANTGLTTSSVAVGAPVTLTAALSDPSLPAQVYFDWGDGDISTGLSASHSWTSSGMKTVTVIANTLDSSYAKIFFKVKVGTCGVARLITSDVAIDADSQGKAFSDLGISSANTGFTVTMMARFTNTSQTKHDLFKLGSWTLQASYKFGDPYGFFFHQAASVAYSTNVPFFDKVAQAAIVVVKVGSVVTETVYIDGSVYTTATDGNSPWPSSATTVQVGAYSPGRFLGGVVSRFNVYNWALTPSDLASDAQGIDVMSTSISGQASSGCQEATASNAPSKAPSTAPSMAPSTAPSNAPSPAPSNVPSRAPTGAPSKVPSITSNAPSIAPTKAPSSAPSLAPSRMPTSAPSPVPTENPSNAPAKPSKAPSNAPTQRPSKTPTLAPSKRPTSTPTARPSKAPSTAPTSKTPTLAPSKKPTSTPTARPSKAPSTAPTSKSPTEAPSKKPTSTPTARPSKAPSTAPTAPTSRPSKIPTLAPSKKPTSVVG